MLSLLTTLGVVGTSSIIELTAVNLDIVSSMSSVGLVVSIVIRLEAVFSRSSVLSPDPGELEAGFTL